MTFLAQIATLGDGQKVKLGRIRPAHVVTTDKYVLREYPDGSHKLTLRLGHYYDASQDKVQPVLTTNWREKAMSSLKRMYLNDQDGDCVIAARYHAVGVWTGNDTPTCAVGTDAEVLATYRIWNPGNQDNGCVITQVLDYTKTHGISVGGVIHKIDDYVSVDWTNKLLVQIAIEEFGALSLGINLPQGWLNAPEGGTWDFTNTPIVGGHNVEAVDYDQNGAWVSTWGGLRLITWRAMASRTWVEEADLPLSPDWYGSDSLAPNGIAVAQLRADLAKLGGGVIPDPGPGPVPPNPIPPTPVPPSPIETIILSQPVKAGQYVRFMKAKSAGVYVKQSGDVLVSDTPDDGSGGEPTGGGVVVPPK